MDTGQAESMILVLAFVWLAICIFLIVANWKLFQKAGEPGWASIIPIYNALVFLKIVGRPWWWLFLMCIPFLGIIFGFIVCIDLAKSFGKDVVFGIGLAILGIVFIPILAFGNAKYVGAAGISA